METKIVHIAPAIATPTYRSQPSETGCILFMTANPKDTQVLNLNKEFNRVQEKQEEGKIKIKLRLRLDVSREQLLEILLKDRPSVIHFSGHGSGGEGLIFQNEEGFSEMVAPEALANLIREFADFVDCVVLNACYSEAQAQAIAKYVPNVIGTDNAIGDEKAIQFSSNFYMALFEGESYESAFRKTVAQIDVQNLGTGAQPVLYRWQAAAATETPKKQEQPPIATTTTAPTEGQIGYWIDERDGLEYRTKVINGKTWLLDNFAYDLGTDECYAYRELNKNADTFGLLYSWAGAKAACPEGWHLPSAEEWQAFLMAAGGFVHVEEEKGDPVKGFETTMEQLDVLLGGYYDDIEGDFGGINKITSFWTSTADSKEEYKAWYVGVDSTDGVVYLDTDSDGSGASVRYIKND